MRMDVSIFLIVDVVFCTHVVVECFEFFDERSGKPITCRVRFSTECSIILISSSRRKSSDCPKRPVYAMLFAIVMVYHDTDFFARNKCFQLFHQTSGKGYVIVY